MPLSSRRSHAFSASWILQKNTASAIFTFPDWSRCRPKTAPIPFFWTAWSSVILLPEASAGGRYSAGNRGRCGGQFVRDTYDWDGDCAPQIAYEDAILYTGHVRHLTMDPSARVKKKGDLCRDHRTDPLSAGTGHQYAGLQPVYEFGELLPRPAEFHGLFLPVPEKQEHHYKRTAGAMARASILHPRLLLPGERMQGKECRIW